jgi:phosphoribosyl-AMP cyclohydrolase
VDCITGELTLNSNDIFGPRVTVEQVEEGTELAPKFDAYGLMPAVTTDYTSGELLMHGYMNAEALAKTIETGEAHYFSRSRQALWHKGATSGLTQKVVELMIDDDQDCVWLRVDVAGGASCHVGYRSCFYRKVPVAAAAAKYTGTLPLEFTETEKIFDPEVVYPGVENPTKL